ncbi:MAG: zinc ribbon domain-containing protein [Clostridia bacterium]
MADDFSKRIETFGQNVWKKAQGAVDIVGLNTDIGIKTKELTQLYTDIGREYCIVHSEQAKAEIPELYEKAYLLAKKISDLEEEIQRCKGLRKCTSCGSMTSIQSTFCPNCGIAMPAVDPRNEPYSNSCGNCGARMESEDQFCASCGAKRE